MKLRDLILVVGDLQYPYYDEKVWKAVLRFGRALGPTGIVLNGDIHDFYDLSRFDKNPARVGHLADEIQGMQDVILSPIVKIAPKAWRVFNEGNHEKRLQKYLWHHAPAVSQLKGLDVPGVLGLKSFGISYRQESNPVQAGSLLILHGHLIRKHSGMTARAHFERYGSSLLHGHSHRWGTYSVTNWTGVHEASEHGCLCDLTPEYEPHPNWQQGFAVVHVFEDRTFHAQVVKIIDRKFMLYGGKQYEV